MPLTVKGGPCSNTKCVSNNPTESKISSTEDLKSPTKDKVKITSNRANASSEINNHTTEKGIIRDLEVKSQKEIKENLEVNSCKDVMLNEPNKNKDQTPMEEWSILSDYVKYVMHDKSVVIQKLSINSMNYRQNKDLYTSLNNEQTIKTNLNFGNSPENLKADYLDMYRGVYVEVISTDRFDEDTDISTTYLGQVDMARDTEVRAEESFPMTTRGYTRGQLLGGTECDVLIDTGTSKSYMSKSCFLQPKGFRLVMDNM